MGMPRSSIWFDVWYRLEQDYDSVLLALSPMNPGSVLMSLPWASAPALQACKHHQYFQDMYNLLSFSETYKDMEWVGKGIWNKMSISSCHRHLWNRSQWDQQKLKVVWCRVHVFFICLLSHSQHTCHCLHVNLFLLYLPACLRHFSQVLRRKEEGWP